MPRLRVNLIRAHHFEVMRNAVLKMTRKHRVNGELVDAPLTQRTAQYALTVCVMAFEVAVERYHLPRNEAALVRPLKPVKPQIKPLTEEQVMKLLEAVDGHRLEPLYYLALTYGFRKGELLGLLWSDINFVKRTITVSGSLQELKGGIGLQLTSPKSDASKRTLRLTDELVEMLQAHRRAMMLEYQERGQPFPINGPVFSSEAGTFIWPRNFTTHYKAVLRRADIPQTFRVHDLRHTMVATALNSGQPLAVVSKYVGHSSVSVTADIYGHRDDSAELKIAEDMGDLLRKRKKSG